MKYVLIVLALMFSSTANLISGQGFASKTNDSLKLQGPKVVFVYPESGTPFDRTCATFLNKPIKNEWM